jgi:hypothetical protein
VVYRFSGTFTGAIWLKLCNFSASLKTSFEPCQTIFLSISPLLSSFITEFDQNETREYVNLEVHADYFVRIKTEQIKPILQVILQLYDGQSQDIKVGAYETHTLGNIDKNIVWHGSTVFRLTFYRNLGVISKI